MSLRARMPDGRWIYGAAAQQHKIKEDGGWDAHHQKFAEHVAKIAVREYNKDLTKQNLIIMDYKKIG